MRVRLPLCHNYVSFIIVKRKQSQDKTLKRVVDQAAAASLAAGFSNPSSLFNPLMSPIGSYYSATTASANSAFTSLHQIKSAFPGEFVDVKNIKEGWEPWSSGHGRRIMFEMLLVRIPAPLEMTFLTLIYC